VLHAGCLAQRSRALSCMQDAPPEPFVTLHGSALMYQPLHLQPAHGRGGPGADYEAQEIPRMVGCQQRPGGISRSSVARNDRLGGQTPVTLSLPTLFIKTSGLSSRKRHSCVRYQQLDYKGHTQQQRYNILWILFLLPEPPTAWG
ncbi:MAG: hypothetical protein KDJ52_31815, partial [Anaerolineae bacterium]|nr:hypothetical protein [Anaerolineae bacterium]